MNTDAGSLKFLHDNFETKDFSLTLADGSQEKVFSQIVFLPPEPRETPLAKAIQLHSLASFVTYLKANPDSAPSGSFIHATANRVELLSPIAGYHRLRETLVVAEAPAMPTKNTYMPVVDCIVWLNVVCTGGGDRDYLLKLLKKVSVDQVQVAEDDGVSQKVTVSSGVHLKETVDTKNPIMLAPFRSFPEVSQVLSAHLLRIDKGTSGAQISLTPADGEKWRGEAAALVAEEVKTLWGNDEGLPTILY